MQLPDEGIRAELQAKQEQAQRTGVAVLGVVFATALWFFSVPPDIRRTRICTQEGQPGCVDASVLLSRVADHYRSCGNPDGDPCITWDLSVDPASVEAFESALAAVRAPPTPSSAE